jgi:uncharacterized protein YcnI
MTRFRRYRFPIALAAATATALLIAGPASAHIHTDPEAVEAGSDATVGFIVEHGCEGSPTTKVEIQMPDGFTDIAGVDAAGFTSSVSGQVVTFSGGTLPDKTEQAFQVSFTAPDQAGEVPVKLIQTCEEGSLDWIETQAPGEEEPEHPAPVLTITEGAPTSGQTEGGHDHDETATTEADHDHAEEGAATTTEAADHDHDETAATDADADSDSDDSSSTAPIIAGVAVAVVVIGGGAYLISRRKGSGGADGTSPTDGTGPDA